MSTGRLAVGDRQAPEAARRRARNWRLKGSVPQTLGSYDGKGVGHRLRVFLDARELPFGRVYGFGSTRMRRVSNRYGSTTSYTLAVAAAPPTVLPEVSAIGPGAASTLMPASPFHSLREAAQKRTSRPPLYR